MEITATSVWTDLEAIRTQNPLIQNITNYVVMNNTANALLALGASPAMVHAQEEVANFVNIASALVVNIGTLSAPWVTGMEVAMQQAAYAEKPVVLDPVGVGATPYRLHTVQKLLSQSTPSVIRGNASEIKALVEHHVQSKGVDSTYSSDTAVEAATQLAREIGCVVVVSGAKDYITDGTQVLEVEGGHPLMGKVTGMGCTASALIGAFLAVNPDALPAATHAMTVMGIAGELAAAKSSGPGTLQLHFYDALYQLTLEQIEAHSRIRMLKTVD
ncbi:hydroxyethylthiazole kinase [Catalinimonas alkaloidigena]|uniref:Hydroxyethylthiazole kinase n=1 Tax=Catalinimonas alkaloidigena TaxID=1075417 RepID=A0A1G8XRG7_9BACT|nr:hydroxyethylthiazole kinase [Catalinimonas alkaloidigena]SDJ92774.1 hydroxyethylthiazole kinase [Catalinimonas alkaloidigena]